MWDSKGCTANVVLLKDEKIYCSNAGDSRCVLSKRGVAFDMSVDHKPDDETEKQRIMKAGSVVTEGRVDGNLNLSRSLGDLKYKKQKHLKPEEHPITANPDLKVHKIGPDCDFLVMACDGIWETKSSQDIVSFVNDKLKKAPKGKLSKIVEDIFDNIISPDYTETQGLGCDNMTGMVIQFKK
jgi:serine/threonine protein phosphatase PrpC